MFLFSVLKQYFNLLEYMMRLISFFDSFPCVCLWDSMIVFVVRIRSREGSSSGWFALSWTGMSHLRIRSPVDPESHHIREGCKKPQIIERVLKEYINIRVWESDLNSLPNWIRNIFYLTGLCFWDSCNQVLSFSSRARVRVSSCSRCVCADSALCFLPQTLRRQNTSPPTSWPSLDQ